MKAKLTHIQSGITKWYTEGAAALGWKAVLAAPLVNLAVSNAIKRNAAAIALLTDENGEIEIEALHKDYSALINKAGNIELLGLKFNSQDLDKLYEAIKAEIPAIKA